ncbi:MAG: hypothetical protein FD126_3150, partial [Elusimicrobia bacterium]
MSAPDEDGVLVGGGAFKVDRAHALEKLKRYQLPAGVGGWIFWARCAAACGADELEEDNSLYGFTLRFGGRPFARAELEDPFAAMFAGRAPGRESRFALALGLLQALESRPKAVSVESGAGADRVRLQVRSLDEHTVEACPGSETRTVLSVRWGLTSELRERFFASPALLGGSAPLFHRDRLRFTAGGSSHWPADAADGRPFRFGSALGRLSLPAFYTPPDSPLHLYKHGVLVCEHRELFPWAKVRAWVNDDKLSLSAGQTGVVRDARLKGLMRLVRREAEAMLFEAAQTYPDLTKRARGLMEAEPAARAVWDRRFKWGAQAGASAVEASWWRRLFVPGAAARDGRLRVVLEAAERTLWLKDAAARL